MMSGLTILDGGMGRELAQRGAPFRQPEWSALALYEAPEAVREVHRDFVRSGAQIITTNSYALVPFHIGEARFAADALRLADLCGRLAREAVETEGKSPRCRIAASIPPLFGSYRHDLFRTGRAAEIAQPLIDGQAPYADLWLFETQSAAAETLAVLPLLPDDGKPRWAAFTLHDETDGSGRAETPFSDGLPHLRSGETVAEAVEKIAQTGVSALLFNCCRPEVVEAAVRAACDTLNRLNRTDIRLGAYANAFPPQTENATANEGLDELRGELTPPVYLAWAEKWRQAGASIIGGCCGIGPEHIRCLAEHLR
ncbi:MAG: homocysteine S-methyltransferase family protein [Neisseria sp.]|nr:homocysteine S-methyltransferase family protein [Neisseria sp.]